jgi:Gpi18-like mannosyltransferase
MASVRDAVEIGHPVASITEYGHQRGEERPSFDTLRAVLLPFAVSRLLLVALTVMAARMQHLSVLAVWDKWDTRWYMGIAAHGYHWHPQWDTHDRSPLAFFPLYPLLTHAGASLGLPALFVAILVSNLAFLAALLYLYRLGVLEWGKQRSRWALWLVALFPTSFFTFAPYTEALFLLCAAGALYHARQKESCRAGLWLAAAVLTRSTAIILLPALVLLLRPAAARAWYRLAGPAVLTGLGYSLYLIWQRISIEEVLNAQLGWHRSITFPWTGFMGSFIGLLPHSAMDPGMTAEDAIDLAVTVSFLVVTAIAWRSLAPWLMIYCLGFWLLVLCTP